MLWHRQRAPGEGLGESRGSDGTKSQRRLAALLFASLVGLKPIVELAEIFGEVAVSAGHAGEETIGVGIALALENLHLMQTIVQVLNLIVREGVGVAGGGGGGGILDAHASLQSDISIQILEGPEEVHADPFARPQAVNTTGALHQTQGIPMDIVIDNKVTILKVLSLGEAVGGNEPIDWGAWLDGPLRHRGEASQNLLHGQVGRLFVGLPDFVIGASDTRDGALGARLGQRLGHILGGVGKGGEDQGFDVGVTILVDVEGGGHLLFQRVLQPLELGVVLGVDTRHLGQDVLDDGLIRFQRRTQGGFIEVGREGQSQILLQKFGEFLIILIVFGVRVLKRGLFQRFDPRLAQERLGGALRHGHHATLHRRQDFVGTLLEGIGKRLAEGIDRAFQTLQGVHAHQRGEGALACSGGEVGRLGPLNAGAQVHGGIIGRQREALQLGTELLDVQLVVSRVDAGGVGAGFGVRGEELALRLCGVGLLDAGTTARDGGARQQSEVFLGQAFAERGGGQSLGLLGVVLGKSFGDALSIADDVLHLLLEGAIGVVERAVLILPRTIDEGQLIGQVSHAVAYGRGREQEKLRLRMRLQIVQEPFVTLATGGAEVMTLINHNQIVMRRVQLRQGTLTITPHINFPGA